MKCFKTYLVVSISFSLVLYTTRVITTHSLFYGFLLWNLILAAVPLLITSQIKRFPKIMSNRLFFFLFFTIWLLFLPNAPYIITDFLHLRNGPMPQWFDILLLMSFAINGLILGLTSMVQMQIFLYRYLSLGKIRSLMIIVCFLCGLGIYMGRFLRYNSWDIITDPYPVFYDILNRVTSPLQHIETWGVTVGFGSLVWITYSLITKSRILENELGV